MGERKRMRGTKTKEHIGGAYRGIAVFAMVLMIFAILLTSFQVAIYGDSEYRFYQKEYEKYTVADALDMQISDVMEVTDYMMDYLIGREDVLSITTDVDGQYQDFFNEQDRLHMADVRNLFLGGLKIRNLCLILAIVLLGVLVVKKVNWKYLFPWAYSAALGVFLVIVVFLGIAFSIDFTRCFTIFHEIFFTNDLWLFDPATDYMIRMLPEGFFSDMVIRIGSTFLILLLVIWLAFRVWKIYVKRHGNESVTDL
jgi:integral membrane protein (TIGR01906 family)